MRSDMTKLFLGTGCYSAPAAECNLRSRRKNPPAAEPSFSRLREFPRNIMVMSFGVIKIYE